MYIPLQKMWKGTLDSPGAVLPFCSGLNRARETPVLGVLWYSAAYWFEVTMIDFF